MNNIITLTIDVPEDLHHSLSGFLEDHVSWDYNEVFAIALTRFLRDEKGLRKAAKRSVDKICLPVLS